MDGVRVYPIGKRGAILRILDRHEGLSDRAVAVEAGCSKAYVTGVRNERKHPVANGQRDRVAYLAFLVQRGLIP